MIAYQHSTGSQGGTMSGQMRYTRRVRYKPDTSPYYPAIITGDHQPTRVQLMSHFALYSGQPMTLRQIAIRINCQVDSLWPLLRQLADEGLIRSDSEIDTLDQTATWVKS